MNTPTIPPAVRTWIYSLFTPVSALLMFYGIAEEQEVALWIAFATSLIQGGTAIAYRPTRSALPADPDHIPGTVPADRGQAGLSLLITVLVIVVLVLLILRLA